MTKSQKLAYIHKRLMKLPLHERWVLIRRAKFKLIKGGRYETDKQKT